MKQHSQTQLTLNIMVVGLLVVLFVLVLDVTKTQKEQQAQVRAIESVLQNS